MRLATRRGHSQRPKLREKRPKALVALVMCPRTIQPTHRHDQEPTVVPGDVKPLQDTQASHLRRLELPIDDQRVEYVAQCCYL